MGSIGRKWRETEESTIELALDTVQRDGQGDGEDHRDKLHGTWMRSEEKN